MLNQNKSDETAVATADRPAAVTSTTVPEQGLEGPPRDLSLDDDSDMSSPYLEKETYTDFPEGGVKAWSVVLGAWCAMTASMGICNTIGFLQAWLTTHQLADYTEAQISWIFSIFSFLLFFGGVQVGPIFDSYGIMVLLIPGCIGIVLSLVFLSLCTQYYQFILGFAILGGISCSMVFTPSVTIVGHWFYKKRGLATGIAASGGAVGGVIFPLVLIDLMPRIGYGWSIRVIALINLVLSVVAVALMRTRLPLEKSKSGAVIDLKAFKDVRFGLTTFGVFLAEWALFIPINYITSYALKKGLDQTFSYQLLAILNAGSVLGRCLPGYMSDVFGRFNVMIVTAAMCAITCLAIWLPSQDHLGPIVLFAFVFGLCSGTGICLTPVCISQICKTEDYGKRYGTCYSVVSIGVLTGMPIAGEILNRQGGSNFTGLICFSAASYIASAAMFFGARVYSTGWKLRAIY
ncbi:hypothetical protein DV451_001252 [Geotrichum candidum]|uniref:Major facilitator superfamily (MFS) profile domain-containing protein n=1 Tax=Geotrichum candidum TaxID=1173061 RepID=A0A9P5G8A6_GEOCN|nr:hypothetical protein DV451_001252 [Geotrichum candidum]